MKNLPDLVRAIISILTVVLGFIYFFLAAFVYTVKDPQITITVFGLVTIVFGYWIGSSLGSSKKQDTIDNLQNKAISDIGGSNPPPSKDEK